MIASKIMSEVVPSIQKGDKTSQALTWMEVFKISHLPVVDNHKYIGIISDSDILDMNNPEKVILDNFQLLRRPFVFDNQHIFEIIHLVSSQHLTTIPVLDTEENYLGLITKNDLAQELGLLLSTEKPGGIITLELNYNDYSLSEIAQIVESNNTKILSLYTHLNQEKDKILVTIKLNNTNVTSVLRTFERYNYKVKNTYSINNDFDAVIQDRMESFFNYLNI